MHPPANEEEEALLEWAEERLKGQYDPCSDCDGKGWDGSGLCPSCHGESMLPRYEYLCAERALTQAQREAIGEKSLVEQTAHPDVSMFLIEEEHGDQPKVEVPQAVDGGDSTDVGRGGG